MPNADPRPIVPTAPGTAAALIAPQAPISPKAGLVDQASISQALAEAFSGTTAAIAGATALPAGTFRGFAGGLPTAAEPPPRQQAALPEVAAGAAETPPPLVSAIAAGAAIAAGSSRSGASGVLGAADATLGPQPAPAATIAPAALTSPPPSAPTPATSAAAGAASPSAMASTAAAIAKPAPEPHPALGFDASFGVPRRPFGKLIYQIAQSYALNPLLVAAIAKVESDFNPHARSRKGACGLMQVLPSTARRFGLPRKRDLFNPRKNLETASRYLRWLVDRFGDDPVRVLAAYNAGEGAVDRFGGVPPFSETRDYVQRIFGLLGFSVLLETPVGAAAVPAAAAASALAGVR
ncbi:MAG TPA: lytic transglycosylase domain-containing protein [Thermoanaerobaculia bacterium]|nr:lytic transglycosylase domain-containing protein [Thermoanaerobaculia bacterium]